MSGWLALGSWVTPDGFELTADPILVWNNDNTLTLYYSGTVAGQGNPSLWAQPYWLDGDTLTTVDPATGLPVSHYEVSANVDAGATAWIGAEQTVNGQTLLIPRVGGSI